MANMILFTLLLAVVLSLLIIALVRLYICLSKRLPPDDPESAYYDEDGNHIYYDRKLIAQLEKERQERTIAEKETTNE